MKSVNKHEESLENVIREAETWVTDGELEIDHFDSEDDESGWYACKYVDGYGTIPLYENGYNEKPLISDETIERYSVDVYKVFNKCGVAYCG